MRRRIFLPDSFEIRFVIGRSIFLVPVLSILLVFFFRIESPWRMLFLIKYLAILALVAWMAFAKSAEERRMIEKFHETYLDERFWRNTDILPITGAVAINGVIVSLIKSDVRWFLVAVALGALLWLGMALRWFVYDRWLKSVLWSIQGGSTD